jgi:3',5'-cyclic AMP phosphodiesterase CpdA
MTSILTTLTQKPIQYDTFHFGGDDTNVGKSGLFGTIVQWDLNEKSDTFKSNFVFFVKKAFAFLDSIGIGTCFYGIGGFNGKLEKYKYYQTGLTRNAEARMKIVTALGGETVCRAIPVVQLNQADLTDYLKLQDNHFRSGQWVIQGEDSAGRKFVAMRTSDRNGQVHIFTIHQRYRETCIHPDRDDGSSWTTNIDDDSVVVQVSTERTLEFIEKIRNSRHERFSIATKL